MIEVLATSEGLVSIRATGKVEKQDWEQVTDTVNDALSQNEKVSLYTNLSDLEGVSAGAVIEDMRFSLKNLNNIDQVDRVAVVADSAWIEKITEASTKVFSDLDAQVFGQEQIAEARQWVEAKAA